MSPRWIRAFLIGCAAWLPATLALATQEPPVVQMKPAPPPAGAPAVAPLAVEATTPAELRKQTYAYVQSVLATSPKIDQATRWTHTVCVSVDGVQPDKAALVKDRIEEVAKALGLRVGRKDCNPNVEIFFTQQPQSFLDKVAAARPALLGYGYRTEADTLKTVKRPIQAWYLTATAASGNTNGMTHADTEGGYGLDRSSGQGVGEILDDPDKRPAVGCGNSRIGGCTSSVFVHVMVVVDLSSVQDKSTGVLADYIAMLAMAQPRSLDGCNSLKSVIDIYAAGCAGRDPPDGLTRADVAYLTSLYKTDLEARKASQETDIASRMADMLLRANKADRLAADGGAQKTSAGR